MTRPVPATIEPGPGAATVLLVGPEAASLAPRLAVSGYRPVTEATAAMPPAAAILSPGSAAQIPELRRSLGNRPLLLGISSDSVEGRSLCLEGGADDIWLPGLGTSDLLTRLRLHLCRVRRCGEEPAAARLQVADLRLDPVARQVWRGGRPLSLTAREYELLLLLLRQQGMVLCRERILAEIWPDQGEGSSNVIEVYVRYLRRKLEAEGERRLIHTVRGRGYCLAAAPPQAGPLP